LETTEGTGKGIDRKNCVGREERAIKKVRGGGKRDNKFAHSFWRNFKERKGNKTQGIGAKKE